MTRSRAIKSMSKHTFFFFHFFSGVTFGSLAALGAYQMSADPARYQSLLVVSCILAALMGYRYTNSGKFMPAGLVASLSIATAVRIILTKVLFVGGPNH